MIDKNKKLFELKEKINELSNELSKVKKEAFENWNFFLKNKSELEIFKKKVEKDKLVEIKNFNKKIFLDLLPILDSFESFINSEKNKSDNTGILLLYKMLILFLNKNGIQKIEVKKYDDFDPAKHEVLIISKSSIYDNKIFSVLQSGYIFQDQVIRYSKVSVFKKE